MPGTSEKLRILTTSAIGDIALLADPSVGAVRYRSPDRAAIRFFVDNLTPLCTQPRVARPGKLESNLYPVAAYARIGRQVRRFATDNVLDKSAHNSDPRWRYACAELEEAARLVIDHVMLPQKAETLTLALTEWFGTYRIGEDHTDDFLALRGTLSPDDTIIQDDIGQGYSLNLFKGTTRHRASPLAGGAHRPQITFNIPKSF